MLDENTHEAHLCSDTEWTDHSMPWDEPRLQTLARIIKNREQREERETEKGLKGGCKENLVQKYREQENYA